MRILISHSYFLSYDPKEAANHKPYPPLAPLTMAAWIKKLLDTDVQFYDVMFDPDEKGLLNKLRQFQPDIFILYDDDFNFLTKMCLENMRNAAFRVLQQVHKSGLFIAHGSDASDQAEAYLKAGFDMVVHRNAEKVIIDILEAYLNSGSFENIREFQSVSFAEGERYVHNPLTKGNLPLGESPMPRWDLIDLSPYREMWRRHHGYFSLNISATHGCPYGCNWCAKPLYGRTYKAIPAAQIARQFHFMASELGADHLWITDDIFGLRPGWLKEFAQELEKVGVNVPYKCQIRADLVNEESARLLARSGCSEAWMGVESGSQNVLDAMEKNLRVEDIYRASRLLRQNGIQVAFFIQFGYPGEEWEDIRKTWNLIRTCKPDFIGISVSYPLKGTKFYDMVVEKMGEKKNWKDSGDLALMFPGKYPPDFYRILYRFTHHYLGFYSIFRPQPVRKRVRRLASQYKHLPGMLKSYLKMRRSLKHVDKNGARYEMEESAGKMNMEQV